MRDKLIVLLLSVAMALILMEVSLRVIGFVHLHNAPGDRAVSAREGVVTILCVGDSFTFGFGAKKDSSYPRQLEGIFNTENRSVRVRVINRGKGADNSAMVLSNLKRNIADTDPDIVVILVGRANFWNAYGYREYLYKRTLGSRLQDFLCNIKLYKLIILLTDNIRDLKYRKTASVDVEDWFNRSLDCEWRGEYEEGIAWRKKVIEKDPASAASYQAIGRMYCALGKKQKAKEFFKKAIEIDPKRTSAILHFANNFAKDPVFDREEIQFLKKYMNKNPVVGDIFEKMSDRQKYDQKIEEWVGSDVARMIQICQEKKIKVVLLNYPNPSGFKHVSDINMVLKETALEYAVPFVDNAEVFRLLSLEGKDEVDYFAADKNHCNEKGYGVLARNIYGCILASKLIK